MPFLVVIMSVVGEFFVGFVGIFDFFVGLVGIFDFWDLVGIFDFCPLASPPLGLV